MSKLTENDFKVNNIDDYIICDRCGKRVTKNEKYIVDNHRNYYCEECGTKRLFKCDICGGFELNGNKRITEDTHKEICEDCAYSHTTICRECGGLYENRNSMYYDDERYYYCEKHKYYSFIHAYGYKPNAKFYFGKDEEHNNSALLTGFELEVQQGNSDISCGEMSCKLNEEINKKYFGNEKFIYFKRDGSVSNGFEIVSQPFTEKFFRENIKIFNEMLDILGKNNYISHDSDCCGLHFHINRKFLQPSDNQENIDKLILFTEYYKEKIQIFSRRQNYYYCKFLSDRFCELSSNERKAKNIAFLKKYKDRVDRYSVVNTKNRNTVEIRVFRGTLIPQTFFATAEFVYNICNACVNLPITKISWNKIVNNEKSKYIKDYCKKRCIPEDRKYMRDFSLDYVKEINKKKKEMRTLQKQILSNLFEMYNGFLETYNGLTKTQFNKILKTNNDEQKAKIKKEIEIGNKMFISQIIATIEECFYRENSYEDFYSIVSKLTVYYERHKKLFYALNEKNKIDSVKEDNSKLFTIFVEIRNDI